MYLNTPWEQHYENLDGRTILDRLASVKYFVISGDNFRYLPMDIAIIQVEDVPERFHAQLNAKSKIYVYRMTINDVPSVFDRKYTFHCFRSPDKKAMQEAALLLTGRHDFKNFSSAKQNKSTVREIYQIEVYDDGEEMQITMHADDFLHNMSRIIVGTLLEIGLGTRKKEDIEEIFCRQTVRKSSL